MSLFSLQKLPAVASVLALSAVLSVAHAQHSDKETKEDVQRHRAMATAHEAAAKCLESGQKPDVCTKQLQAAGLAAPVPLERHAFYAAAARAFVILRSGEQRPYGNLLLRKGVWSEESA